MFKQDYKLKPLSNVEEYIKENNHLPGIPSASDMKKNGIGISELQTKLLSKVEELTLRLIEQNKKVSSLIEENEKIKKELASLKNEKQTIK